MNKSSINSKNTLTLDGTYFERAGKEDADFGNKYVDSLLWAVTTMAGCSFGDVTSITYFEMIMSILFFLVGASALAKVFADFASLMYLLSIEKTQ